MVSATMVRAEERRKNVSEYLIVLFALICSAGLEVVTSIIGSPVVRCIDGLGAFFLLTWLLSSFTQIRVRWLLPIAILIGACLLQLPERIANPKETLLSLPIFLCQLVGILFGWVFSQAKAPIKYVTLAVVLFIGVGMAWRGINLWYFKMSYGTFSGTVSIQPSVPFILYDTHGKTINLTSDRKKAVLLDFWFTSCGACFDEFPKVQKLYDRLKTNPNIAFYTVNRPVPGDTVGQAAQMIQSRHYTFPVLITDGHALPDSLGITVYPTIVILDDNHRAIYRGDLAGAEKLISEFL